MAQLTQQHRQDEALSEDEDEEEPEEEEDDEADPSFSGEPAARAKPGGRAAKRKLPTKNSDEGTSAACTASGGSADFFLLWGAGTKRPHWFMVQDAKS